ncbi:hypothetical protein [Nocardia noduli]|uniref:hypothetical protein n=1 Tax=Nocardia noduli TaxID=2815722 RepID=UPI001C230134|nr:hypothetical protein [Nocardia noduli]
MAAQTRKPAVAARRDARARLAARQARELQRLELDEADMTNFVESQTDLDAATTTLDGELQRAGRQRDQRINTAVTDFHSALEHGPTTGAPDHASRDAASGEPGLTALGEAIDQAAADYRTAALTAARQCTVNTAGARARQGHALHRLRERGMSVADIAEATALSTTRVSRLIKHRNIPDTDHTVGTAAIVSTVGSDTAGGDVTAPAATPTPPVSGASVVDRSVPEAFPSGSV